jgi:hypothetical protein
MTRHRKLSQELHIILDVSFDDISDIRERGARFRDGHFYINKRYYNLAAFEKWIPASYDLEALLKNVKKPPPTRKRIIISSPLE